MYTEMPPVITYDTLPSALVTSPEKFEAVLPLKFSGSSPDHQMPCGLMYRMCPR